ncbi:MAG: aspartate racemase [Chlamydiales bacterium]
MVSLGSIGLIGGAGPEAGAVLFQEIVTRFQQNFDYQLDGDFPEIMLYNFPFRDMLGVNGEIMHEGLRQELTLAIKKLQYLNIEILAVACNTLHCFLEKGCLSDQTQFVHIVDEMQQEIEQRQLSRVLVLATSTTRRFSLYSDPVYIFPKEEEQYKVDHIILNILSGKDLEHCVEVLVQMMRSNVEDAGCEVALLGCTELSVLRYRFPKIFKNIDFIDPIVLLAQKICQLSHHKRRFSYAGETTHSSF